MENNFSKLRLRSRQDFQRVQRRGQSFKLNHWLLLSFLKTDGAQIRAGWTVPRYVGNAVIRNRLKRWMRESLRSALPKYQNFCLDVNFVFLNRGPLFYKGLSHETFNQSIVHAVKKFETMALPRA